MMDETLVSLTNSLELNRFLSIVFTVAPLRNAHERLNSQLIKFHVLSLQVLFIGIDSTGPVPVLLTVGWSLVHSLAPSSSPSFDSLSLPKSLPPKSLNNAFCSFMFLRKQCPLAALFLNSTRRGPAFFSADLPRPGLRITSVFTFVDFTRSQIERCSRISFSFAV